MLNSDWIYNTFGYRLRNPGLNPFIYSFGKRHLFNNQLCYQTKFNQTKLQTIGNGHGSVGVTFGGYKMVLFFR